MAKDTYISMPVIRRLPRYYRFLYDLKENGVTRISSRELSRLMGLTASRSGRILTASADSGSRATAM